MATITERIKQFLNDILENRQLEKVQKDASAIQGMRNPSETIQMAAVKNDGLAIQYISNPYEVVKMAAVQQNPEAILFIEKPSEQVQLAAVSQDGNYIQTIDKPSERVAMAAVKNDGLAIEHIYKPSEAVKMAAVQQNPEAILFIEKPSEQVQLAAVSQNGNYIQAIDYPSERVAMVVVNQGGSYIAAIDKPSETIQMAAVKNDGLAIQYISKPSEAVKMAAVQSNGYAIEFISNPTEKMKIEAVKNNAYSIIEMEEPTPSVCKIALEKMYGRPINVAMVEPTELAKKTQILLNNLVGLKFEYRTVYQTYGKAAEEDPLQMSIQEKKDKFRTEMEEKYPGMFQNKTQSTQKDHNTTNLKEQELYSSETKILIGDISSKKEITNLRIKDKITGKTEPLNSNGIRLLDQPSECIEKILSGKKVEFTTNSGKGYLTGLCKTPLGWGLTIGKQIQSSTDSSATL